jgi:hypothetical protein
MKCLLLQDNRAGNNRQAQAVVDLLSEKIDIEVTVFQMKYNILSRLPNCILYCMSYASFLNNYIKSHDFDLIVSAGRKAAMFASQFKEHLPQVKWIQLMHPGFIANKADILLLPEHDQHKINNSNNVIYSFGTPTCLHLEKQKNGAEDFKKHYGDYKFATILIGGNHKNGVMEKDLIFEIADAARNLIKKGYFVLISTSRRTKFLHISLLKKLLKNEQRFILYYPNKKNKQNLYLTYLYLAELIIITGDSVAMVSEAIAAEKPCFYIADETLLGNKQKYFLKSAENRGLISKYNEDLITNNTTTKVRINELNDKLTTDIIAKLNLA